MNTTGHRTISPPAATLPGGVEWREPAECWAAKSVVASHFARAWGTTISKWDGHEFTMHGCKITFVVVRRDDFFDIHALGTRPAWVKRGEECDAR